MFTFLVSEVHRDGAVFSFQARYSAEHWSATIWGEDGQRLGAIACTSMRPWLSGEALQDAVSDWVRRAVLNDVGFRSDLRTGTPLPQHDASAFGTAGNDSAYGPAPLDAPLPGMRQDAAFQEATTRSAELRAQSMVAMARFQAVAEELVQLCKAAEPRAARL